MRIVIIRHADPDYDNNTLTPQGFKEAEALGKHYNASMFDDIYCSSLARARLTCDAVIKGEKDVTVCDWLQEFYHPYTNEDGLTTYPWDFMPNYVKRHPEVLYNPNYLDDYQPFKDINLKKEHDIVITEFDKILAKHGYKRNGLFYDVLDPNEKTIAFFCHFGMMSVLIAHIMNVPYTLIAQFLVCLPSGVTMLVSEEREKGVAQFRMQKYGDISHLKMEGIDPAFNARFCELFDNFDERH